MNFYNEENLEDLIDYECDNFEENSFEKGNKYCNIFSEKHYYPTDKEKETFVCNYSSIYIDKEVISKRFTFWKNKVNQCFHKKISYEEFEKRLSKFIYFKNLCFNNNIEINLDFNYTNYHVIYLSQVEWWLVQCIGFNTFYTFSENCNTLQFSDNIYLTVLLRGYYYGNVKIIPSIHQYY